MSNSRIEVRRFIKGMRRGVKGDETVKEERRDWERWRQSLRRRGVEVKWKEVDWDWGDWGDWGEVGGRGVLEGGEGGAFGAKEPRSVEERLRLFMETSTDSGSPVQL